MTTNLFDQRRDTSPIADPYDEGGLRVWDDYQFRRKGTRLAGGPWPPEPVKPPVILYPPTNIVLPDIEGLESEGHDLFCTEGTWNGTLPITYDYQWYRVAFAPEAAPPLNTAVPVISGSTTEGSSLLCPTGTWTGATPIFYEYQWYRTAVVIAAPPSNTTPPNVTGSHVVGSLLTTTNGLWDGTPSPTFARQWKRGPSTNVGTGGLSYTTVPGDIGSTITCVVTATNSSGVVTATSNTFGPITDVPSPGEALTDDEGEILTTDDGEELTT